MAKGKRGSIDNPITTDDLKQLIENQKPPYVITKANIKDDFCLYTYEITSGLGLGDKHKVDTKSGIVKETLSEAFGKLRVHLAAIDDVFKHGNVEIEDIDDMHFHDLTDLYTVTGFEIQGGEDNESIIILGNKYVSCVGGRIEMKTPKIPLDNLSSYKWYNELKQASDDAREEVRLYKEGNYIPVTKDEPEDKGVTQLTIGSAEAANDSGEEEMVSEESFETGKL